MQVQILNDPPSPPFFWKTSAAHRLSLSFFLSLSLERLLFNLQNNFQTNCFL